VLNEAIDGASLMSIPEIYLKKERLEQDLNTYMENRYTLNPYAKYINPINKAFYETPSSSHSLDYLNLMVSPYKLIYAKNIAKLKIINQKHTKKNSKDEVVILINKFLKDGMKFIKSNSNIDLISETENSKIIRYWSGDESYPTNIFIFTCNSLDNSNSLYFNQDIGNNEIIFVPENIKNILNFEQISTLEKCQPSQFIEIQKNLYEGQMLNLSTLTKIYNINMDAFNSLPETDCYTQYFKDFCKYQNEGRFRNSMVSDLSSQNEIYTLHQTSKKSVKEITKDKSFMVSKTGCLGSGVYCTTMLANNIPGGHAIGLFKRSIRNSGLNESNFKNKLEHNNLEISKLENKNQIPSKHNGIDFLAFKVKYNGNKITNWIERMGNGRLYLSAKNRMFIKYSTSSISPHIKIKDVQSKFEKISNDVVKEYSNLYVFLEYISKLRGDTEICLNEFWSKFEKARKIAPVLLNNIFFEVVKDYIMLNISSDDAKYNLCKKGSFDMDAQYEIIFKLSPKKMRINWNTVMFSPSLKQLNEVMSAYKKKHNSEGMLKFIKERMLFYINLRCLEGQSKLPSPFLIKTTDCLARYLPNLSGLLHHFISAGLYKNTPFFDEHLEYLRKSEKVSNESKHLKVLIKSGTFRTEECLIGAFTDISGTYNPTVTFKEGLTNMKEEDIKISVRPSKFNGFTQRS
jgi:hypothetical protein